MLESSTRLKKLQKYLKIDEGIDWTEYLQRFEGTKPIELWMTNYPFRLQPEEVEFEAGEEILYKLNNSRHLKKIKQQYKLVVGFKKKVTKSEVADLPYLRVNVSGLEHLIHKDIIDLMLKLCPDDFEPIPVQVISANPHVEPFELNDYYTINVIKCIKAIDEPRSDFEISRNGVARIKKFRYKENPWQDGCKVILGKATLHEKFLPHKLDKPCKLAIDALSGAIVWHPEVARLFPYDSLFWFIQDIEQGRFYK
jgi:hypothetical protein